METMNEATVLLSTRFSNVQSLNIIEGRGDISESLTTALHDVIREHCQEGNTMYLWWMDTGQPRKHSHNQYTVYKMFTGHTLTRSRWWNKIIS